MKQEMKMNEKNSGCLDKSRSDILMKNIFIINRLKFGILQHTLWFGDMRANDKLKNRTLSFVRDVMCPTDIPFLFSFSCEA